MTARALAWTRVAWVAATLVMTFAWRAEALVLLVGLAFLAPLVREVVPAPDRDERQRLEDYRASHIALMATFALLFVFMAKGQFVDGVSPSGELLALLFIPLVVRIGIGLGRGWGARRAGLTIGLVTGAAWTGFALLSHGLSAATTSEVALGGSVLVATAIGLRWPAGGGGLLTLLGFALSGLLVLPAIARGAWGPALTMTAALAVPTLVAGLLLVSSARAGAATGADEFADLR